MTTSIPNPKTPRDGVVWTNWVGNQSFTASELCRPRDEAGVQDAVRRAAESGVGLRVAATGHSFTPIVQTDGVLLDLEQMTGIVGLDAARRRVTALAGTPVSAFGEPLWNAGLALSNQGDIDTQRIAGAVATGTHGSGLRQQSFSGTVRSLRLVTASGDVLDIDEREPTLLHAAQVAVGMLGVITRLELEATDAYRLQERIEYPHLDEVLEQWNDAVERHRHFSCFWMPTGASPELYGLACPPDLDMCDRCYVKIYDELPSEPDDVDRTPGRRRDRAYRIYPDTFEPNFHEMEYMVPAELGKEAVQAVRRLIYEQFPDCIYPVEVRFTAADDAYLSANYERDTTVISVSGRPGTDYEPFLRAFDRTLQSFDARPHWGKLHFMTEDRLPGLFPQLDAFRSIRRRLDPDGLFLNDHLRPLFA